jgi:aminopeptidase YwaD
MKRKKLWVLIAAMAVLGGAAAAQYLPNLYWTFLPKAQMDVIVGEASGEAALRTIMDLNAYNRDRSREEFQGTFWETQVINAGLKRAGIANVQNVPYPGGEAWDGLKGELWEVKPRLQKLASMTDMVGMLAAGSANTDVTADLVWVGRGTLPEIEAAKVEGKIVVSEGGLGQVYNIACNQKGALGVVSIAMSRPYFDPLQMPWSQVGGMRGGPGGQRGGQRGGEPPAGGQPPAAPQPPAQPATPPAPKFAFQIPVREGDFLKSRLMANEKITVHAVVEAKQEKYQNTNTIAFIPGADPNAGEVILSAHLFEGMVKQGANDNNSGSATILEVARTLNTLIGDGRLPRPKRGVRFIWGPEISGIGIWVKANKAIMDKTLCNINMDMVGEYLSKNQAFFCLMRTTFGNPHYINDVMENYYRYVGEGNRERLQNRGDFYKVPVRIVSPFGADEPFWYSIETNYGASDHVVFNDWGVRVPGIMMIAWPDRWYHTTEDLPDKADSTQLKRAAAIGAAGAYTVANADDAMAVKIAGEIASNATRRLGHYLVAGLETLNKAEAKTFEDFYRDARTFVEAGVLNEKDTLDSVLQLVSDKAGIGAYVEKLKKSVEAVGAANLAALQAHMEIAAKGLGVKPVALVPTEAEKKAAAVKPRPTAKVTTAGYQGYRDAITAVPADVRTKYPYAAGAGNTGELNLLINGKHSILDIKKMLDAQGTGGRKSTIEGITNYLQVLKAAGLVEF